MFKAVWVQGLIRWALITQRYLAAESHVECCRVNAPSRARGNGCDLCRQCHNICRAQQRTARSMGNLYLVALARGLLGTEAVLARLAPCASVTVSSSSGSGCSCLSVAPGAGHCGPWDPARPPHLGEVKLLPLSATTL